jgi:hypothetical protein
MEAETLRRATAGLALAVGAGAVLAPARLLSVYGVEPGALGGVGALGWRLFGVRNLFVGGAAWCGDATARAMIPPVQAADQALFAHALRTSSVPAAAAIGAMATSGLIVALELAARRAA